METSDSLVAAERARQDLEDIRTLKNTEAFSRYWMRRLRQRKEDAEKRLKYDKLSAEDREIARVTFLAYDELEKMMDVDEGNIRGGMKR
jgi:cephalosporin-C deacetylase-like acetyl esterase